MSKKTVDSNCPEFGYELLSAIPYAYNLHLKGELQETISGFDTSCLYFFSPKHTESDCKRSWDNMTKLWNEKFPNITIHRPQLDWDLFSPPPFKEYYQDKMIKFEKETIVIFNRYNMEWGKSPINFLDADTLDKLFGMLSNEYQIVYINLNKGEKYFDGALPMKLNDDEVLNKYPNVYSLYDLLEMYPNISINELQLRVFANCSKYISSNGGQLILSAYFGGENIIFSKTCRELNPNVNSFYKWYHKLGDGVFQHVDNYDDLIELVRQKWVLKKPLINILIRTSNRPNYFENCVKSIYEQTYLNWNIIIGVDDVNTLKYTQSAKGRDIVYDYTNIKIPNPPNNIDYGIKFKYNSYLNDLQNEVNDGYIIYLDDDDKLHNQNSLLTLTDVIKNDDVFVIWRVKFPNRLVPSDENFGKPPVCKDISGIGYSFHVKNKEMWEPYKRGDYRVANTLYHKIPNTIYLNEIITELQRDIEDGMGLKDDIKKSDISIIIPTYNTPEYLDECLNSILMSIDDLNCEILVGIDGCQKTLDYVKSKSFDVRFKFYFFNENVGPYVIKNSLVKISKSDKIMFFDSDDIIVSETISKVIKLLDSNDLVKLMFSEFHTSEHLVNKQTLSYGEGVFGINKNIFLNKNGFRNWRCAADSDFMSRLYIDNVKISSINDVSFYRRVHKNSLTMSDDTGLSSALRRQYIKSVKKTDKLLEYKTSTFYVVEVNRNVVETQNLIPKVPYNPFVPKKFEPKKKEEVINEKSVISKQSIDYQKINDRLKIVELNPTVRNNTETNMSSIMEIKTKKRKGGGPDKYKI
jgi:glycosyltransferase involved in cell wall biosynthesis